MLATRKSAVGLLALVYTACYFLSAAAGPSYNNQRKEFQKLSQDAGAALQASFMTFHDMLYWLERLDLEKVQSRRLESLKQLDQALEFLKVLAEKVPKQPIILKTRSKDDEDAMKRLRERLSDRKLEFPKTEADLAQLAVTVVSTYRRSLETVKFSGKPSDYQPLRRIIGEKSFVEEIGILSSIAWHISETQ